jgi:Domain of unknown function (DUF3291)
MSAYELAQLNIGIIKGAMDSPVQIMRRRRGWFERMDQAFLVLWWVPAGHRPSIAEAIEKLELLRSAGPSAQAFTFRQSFPPPDAAAAKSPVTFGDECPAT